MSLDREVLCAALDAHPAVARILLVETRGSVPREAGTAMLIWDGGASGTIGGGALEWEAMAQGRAVLEDGRTRVLRMPLGPALGQCCGGAVTLVVERLDTLPPTPWVRRVEGAAPRPEAPFAGLKDGWLCETDQSDSTPIWVWGAGHVGRALVRLLAPLPDFAVTWIDVADDRFPPLPDGVTRLVGADPALLMPHAPARAHHLILTYSHELDLSLCHAALHRGFAQCGLIGSETKWARFQTRLRDLGHSPETIAQIVCPIGDPTLGKHPQAIAVGVAAALLSSAA